MARPAKPTAVIEAEGKSHRTKAEMERRKRGEAAMLTGKKCFERERIKNDPVAHMEYQRLIKLMRAIGKDDALYAPEYNRYCELFSEEEFYKQQAAELRGELADLSTVFCAVSDIADTLKERAEHCDWKEVMELAEEVIDKCGELLEQRGKLFRLLSEVDAKIKQKRDAMFAIEKENCMTVSAALRTIPKEAEKKEQDPLAELLSGE